MLLDINKASLYLSVSKPTLRRWEKEGKIKPQRTNGNHRRYDTKELNKLLNTTDIPNELVIGYSRVSTKNQIDDLKRQTQCIETYCISRGYQFKIIEDIGSGLNYNKSGLLELIKLINEQKISKIVLNYKDRLIRFGYELIEKICELNDVDIEIINHTENKTYNEELVDDVLSIITVYSAKLYGKRSHKQKKIKDDNIKLFKNDKK